VRKHHGAKMKRCRREEYTNGAENGGVCVKHMEQRSNNADAALKDVQTCPPRRSLHRARGISQHER